MSRSARRPAPRVGRRRRVLLALAAAVVVAVQLPAQQPARAPKRPKLARSAEHHDDRDWRSYMECGTSASSYDRMHACLYWAARLDPSRPEPQYALWWASEKDDTVAHRRALLLDPFVYHARVLMIQPQPAGIFTPPDRKAWGALSIGDYYAANRHFADQLALHPDDLDSRWGAAIAFYYRAMYDSSAGELRALEDSVRARRAKHLSILYESLDFVEYMQATAHLAGGRRDSARATLERSLTDNLAFYHSRMMLADMETADGDTAAAAADWTQVRDISADDVVARRRYAVFLLASGRAAEAERELRAVLAAEPDWVTAHGDIARAIDAQGASRRADAVAAYEQFLARAPDDPAEPRRAASERLAALRGH